MKSVHLLAVAVLLSLPLPVRADGNEFLSKCSRVVASLDQSVPSDTVDSVAELGYQNGYCIGFAQGFTGALYTYGVLAGDKVHLVCLPSKSIKNGQALRVIVAYMKAHPEKLHLEEIILATFAFREAFPCGQRDTEKGK